MTEPLITRVRWDPLLECYSIELGERHQELLRAAAIEHGELVSSILTEAVRAALLRLEAALDLDQC